MLSDLLRNLGPIAAWLGIWARAIALWCWDHKAILGAVALAIPQALAGQYLTALGTVLAALSGGIKYAPSRLVREGDPR